ncbi:MAG TPA: ABC transporter substrate-binding protein [Candidatus Acidoferrales bacterium]|nr:ABC transporter substrate-binding protein [Candidatus Acidoferrales bacterium]
MKSAFVIVFVASILLSSAPVHSQYTKPVYISLPSAGNLQHLALAAAKFKGFYNEMGIANAQVVFLRGNSVNVQALVAGSVQFASAFGPAMHAMFRGEQIRILMPIFNQIPFSLVTRPEIKRLEDLKGAKIAVTFGGSTYSVLIALLAKNKLATNFAEYLNIPGDQGKIAALMQGRASAALMAPPSDRQLLKEGYKRLVYIGDVFKGVPFSAMLTTAKIIQEEPDLVQRGVTAVTKALLFIRENREGGIEMIMRHGQVDKELATSLYDLMRDAYSTELTPEGVMQRAELEIATLKERPNFDPKAFMDDRFLKNALRSLGR